MNPILKQYIEASTAFRKTKGAEDSIHKLYDILYDLEAKKKSTEEKRILTDIYTLLEFHSSAYELFKEIANKQNSKDITKLYTLESKAKSHKNTFSLKDLRKLKARKSVSKLKLSDFELYKGKDKQNTESSYRLKTDKVIIFNKELSSEDVEIFVHQSFDFAHHFERLQAYFDFLSDAKNELITFYNAEIMPHSQATAYETWYLGLEVYSAVIGIDSYGELFAEISIGDMIDKDHILNIEFSDKKITLLGTDG